MTYKELLISKWKYSQDELDDIMTSWLKGNVMSYRLDSLLEKEAGTRNSEVLRGALEALSYSFENLTGPASWKQKKWERLTSWIRDWGNALRIRDMDDHIADYFYEPVAGDLTIRVLKELQNREGVTKDELSDKLGKCNKTIQNELSKLNSKKKGTETRICGQIVKVPIRYWDEADEEDKHKRNVRHYCTPNSLHPVFLQMNVMQAGTLLASLESTYHNDEWDISLGLALDLWCQLTEYGRERVKIAFPGCNEFWEELDDLMDGQKRTPSFVTERQLAAGNISNRELLRYISKNGCACNIELYEDGELKMYEGYHIQIEPNTFQGEIFYVVASNPRENWFQKFEIKVENITKIEPAKR